MQLALRLLTFVAALCATAPSLLGQSESQACKELKYEHRNQIDNVPFRIGQLKGTASDPQGVVIPKVCVGIFTETEHKLVATAETTENGVFEVKSIPAGDYRLVAQYPGFCPANVRLRVEPRFRSKKILLLHMRPPTIDGCSYGQLAERKSGGRKATTTTRNPKATMP